MFFIISNFYNFIFLGAPIFLLKILLYFCNFVKNQNIHRIDERTEIYCFNYKNEDNMPKLLNANLFVEEETSRQLQNKEALEYSLSFKLNYITNLREKFNIPTHYRINVDKFNSQIKEGLNLAISLNKLIVLSQNIQENFKYLYICIKLNYFICWLYILFVSLSIINPNVPINFMDTCEPFSGFVI